MRRFLVSTSILAGAVLAFGPSPASGQVRASVQVSWQWSDDGWRPGPVVDGYVHWSDGPSYRDVRYDRAPVRVRHASKARFRVPPGHMPPPGMCRVWVVGRPPGHQPPPRSCARVFRNHYGPDVVILHTPGRGDGDWRFDGRRDRDRWDDDDWDDDRWDDDDDDDRRDGRGRPGRGRGRGGRS